MVPDKVVRKGQSGRDDRSRRGLQLAFRGRLREYEPQAGAEGQLRNLSHRPGQRGNGVPRRDSTLLHTHQCQRAVQQFYGSAAALAGPAAFRDGGHIPAGMHPPLAAVLPGTGHHWLLLCPLTRLGQQPAEQEPFLLAGALCGPGSLVLVRDAHNPEYMHIPQLLLHIPDAAPLSYVGKKERARSRTELFPVHHSRNRPPDMLHRILHT